jgi:peptide/nickel transport system substrate-binding protein
MFANRSAGSPPQPSYGGTLVVGVSGGVDSFNPLFGESALSQQITHLMLLGLADLDENSEFKPELASSWQRSEDFKQLTYHLREDAFWSDGVPVTAEDVKFTFDLLMDSTVASPRAGVTEYIKQVVVLDARTIRFDFTEAYPDQMFDTAGEVLPKHILANADRQTLRSHAFGRNPLSSGPFLLHKWVSQQYIELVPNLNYFAGRPYLDKVVFKIVPDQTNLLLQLRTGEIDMMIGVPPEEVATLQQNNPNLAIHPVSGRVYYYIGYNNANPLFASKKVRRALTMAVDRQGIIQAFLYGFGSPCLGPVPPMIKWVDSSNIEAVPYAVAEAKQLLAEEGWTDANGDGWLDKNGEIFTFSLKTNVNNQLRSDIAVIVQDQWRKIGVKTEIEPIEWSTMVNELRSGNFTAYMGGWSTAFSVDLTPIFHSSAVEMFNFINYANPDVDLLIETGREEMNRSRAAAIWQEAQKKVYDDQPYTFLFWKDNVVAISNRFGNVNPIPLSALYDLEKWYVSSTY